MVFYVVCAFLRFYPLLIGNLRSVIYDNIDVSLLEEGLSFFVLDLKYFCILSFTLNECRLSYSVVIFDLFFLGIQLHYVFLFEIPLS